jgi:hypothetical protein
VRPIPAFGHNESLLCHLKEEKFYYLYLVAKTKDFLP